MDRSQRAAIVLCGGHSRRMGMSKAWLPFGDETILQRVVRILQPLVEQVVVVAATSGQQLPPLSADVIVTHDSKTDRGPLQGMHAGLSVLSPRIAAAFITSCDVPLLVPGFVEQMFTALAEYDVAVVADDSRLHPLSAVYRPSVLPRIEQLLAAERMRPVFLYDLVSTIVIPADELRTVDPLLTTLQNLNTPDEYLAAAANAGFAVPVELRNQLGKQL